MDKQYNPIVKMDSQILEQFDITVQSCVDAMTETKYSIMHSITLLTGIEKLKDFFNQPQIKHLVESAKDNEAGFLTDDGNYTYNQLINALIPRMLEGYRITGNEINIIKGRGMAVKRGKFRRIIELTDSFAPTIGSPHEKTSQTTFKCVARWTKNGEDFSIGIAENDPCLISLKSGTKWDTIDKLIGLAESKLYTRVLTRITGNFVNDVELESSTVNVTPDHNGTETEIISEKISGKLADQPFSGDERREPQVQAKIHTGPVSQTTTSGMTAVVELRSLNKTHPSAILKAMDADKAFKTKMGKALQNRNQVLASELLSVVKTHISADVLSVNVSQLKKAFEDPEYIDNFERMDKDGEFSRKDIKTIINNNDDVLAVKALDSIRIN